MKTILIVLVAIQLIGCGTLKYRWKNVNGDRSEAQINQDWKDCYEHSSGQRQMQRCVEKKGYYSESYEE
jgi:uncharacterized protein YxeA